MADCRGRWGHCRQRMWAGGWEWRGRQAWRRRAGDRQRRAGAAQWCKRNDDHPRASRIACPRPRAATHPTSRLAQLERLQRAVEQSWAANRKGRELTRSQVHVPSLRSRRSASASARRFELLLGDAPSSGLPEQPKMGARSRSSKVRLGSRSHDPGGHGATGRRVLMRARARCFECDVRAQRARKPGTFRSLFAQQGRLFVCYHRWSMKTVSLA